jgi:hypothetical protein
MGNRFVLIKTKAARARSLLRLKGIAIGSSAPVRGRNAGSAANAGVNCDAVRRVAGHAILPPDFGPGFTHS